MRAMDRLDSKPHADRVKRACQLADKALGIYDEPTLTLIQLRATIDRQLRGTSLSDFVVSERQAGR